MGRATEVKFMKRCSLYGTMVVALLGLTSGASARDVVLPAGTLLQCTLNEPNFSSASVDVGDPVLCHLHGVSEFGRQAFPRGSYLVGHLEASKEPGHFFGRPESQLYHDSAFSNGGPTLAARGLPTQEQTAVGVPHASYASLVSRDVVAPLRLSTAPGMPVFVLKTGTILAVGNYTYQDGRISYSLASGGTG